MLTQKNSWNLTYIPCRSLLPSKVDNLLVACRAFSSDAQVNEYFNLIPHCMALGQAAGTAAAVSINDGVNLRKVNCQALQASLVKQGVPLSGAVVGKANV